MPIVRNLYQSKRQILWGFTHSLISKDLLTEYSWSGRSGGDLKRSFAGLKQIQNVIFSACRRIIADYTITEFETDFKANLSKSSNLKMKDSERSPILVSCTTSPEKQ